MNKRTTKSKRNLEKLPFHQQKTTSSILDSGKSTVFLLLFLSAQLSFSQELDKKIIEEKLLSEARSTIENYRKGEAQLTLLTDQGEPLGNIKVEVNQLTHDFLFGNLSEEVFHPELTEEERAKFTEMFTTLFNFTELTVKWSPFEPHQGMPEWEKLQQKLDWCKENGILPKGHTLGWTHDAGTPAWLYQYSVEDATQLYQAIVPIIYPKLDLQLEWPTQHNGTIAF